jgi:hypothetical protein
VNLALTTLASDHFLNALPLFAVCVFLAWNILSTDNLMAVSFTSL